MDLSASNTKSKQQHTPAHPYGQRSTAHTQRQQVSSLTAHPTDCQTIIITVTDSDDDQPLLSTDLSRCGIRSDAFVRIKTVLIYVTEHYDGDDDCIGRTVSPTTTDLIIPVS